jgi:hypothetical protein
MKNVNFDYVNYLIAKSYDKRGETNKALKIIGLINDSSFRRSAMVGDVKRVDSLIGDVRRVESLIGAVTRAI